MVGRLSLLEEERDIGLQRGLIAFDREVAVGLTAYDIRGQLALREKRIGGDVLALNVDAIEQRDEHSDRSAWLLPGLLRAGCRLFWV